MLTLSRNKNSALLASRDPLLSRVGPHSQRSSHYKYCHRCFNNNNTLNSEAKTSTEIPSTCSSVLSENGTLYSFEYRYLPLPHTRQPDRAVIMFALVLLKRRFGIEEEEPQGFHHLMSPILTATYPARQDPRYQTPKRPKTPHPVRNGEYTTNQMDCIPDTSFYRWDGTNTHTGKSRVRRKTRLFKRKQLVQKYENDSSPPPKIHSPDGNPQNHRQLDPYVSENRAVLAFACPRRAALESRHHIRNLSQAMAFEYVMTPFPLSVRDLKDLAVRMKMNVIVVLDSRCDITSRHEIHDIALIRTE